MRVSIVMAVHNCSHSIDLAVWSILKQSYDNWELIVIDDGSTDDTVERIQKIRDKRIIVKRNRQNIGLPASLNKAISLARGGYIARMDADDISYPERIEKQVKFLDKYPNVDLVSTRIMVFQDDGTALGTPVAACTHSKIVKKPLGGFYMPHPTWMGRRTWFAQNQYDESYLKAQDQQLLLRTFRSSVFACINEILLGYRQEKLSVTKIIRGRYYFAKALMGVCKLSLTTFEAYRGVAEQIAKAILDSVSISMGVERIMLRHRALPIQSVEEERWKKVWQDLNRHIGD